MERARIRGIVTTVTTLLRAVRVMERAVSPRATKVMRFEVGPPGQAAMSMRPTAHAAGSPKRWASAKPTGGSTRSWLPSPTKAARGNWTTLRKSRMESDIPSPIMMMIRETGSTTAMKTLSSMEAWVEGHPGLVRSPGPGAVPSGDRSQIPSMIRFRVALGRMAAADRSGSGR